MALLIRRFLGPCMMLVAIAGILLTSGFSSLAATPKQSVPSPEDFPVYPTIKPNVAFWIDIFTKYSRSQGVIHDNRDLSRVYGVVALNPENTRRASKQNRKTKEKALDRYGKILLKLARGNAPETAEEKRVAALFGPDAKADVFKRAKQHLRIQTGLNRQFKEGIIRSGALLGEFKRIFRSHGLPEDLVYLPCVESSFDVAAYSKFGAAGIWQFTRSTGRLYMKIGYVVDERRDPFIATQAAAKLLKRNFGELRQWPLAITAYNHGLNGMKRAKKQHKTYPRIHTSYRSRSFKFASRNFYPEFLAAREVAKNYKQYFGDLKLDRPVTYTRFRVKGYVPARDLARDLGLDIDLIQKLNPALRKPVFDGRKHIPKGFELRLPNRITRDAVARAAGNIYLAKQKPSRFHRVRKGDTAGSIARTHKVSLRELILANSLGRKATIYIGQTLRIPVPDETIPLKTALAKKEPVKPASNASTPVSRSVEKPVVAREKPVPTPVVKKNVAQPDQKPSHDAGKPEKTVLAAVGPAPPAGPPSGESASAGPLPEAELQAKPVQAAGDINLTVVTSDLKLQRQSSSVGVLHVVSGETLGHYADWLGIATQKIRNLNRMAFGRPISIGQAIKIPLPQSGFERFEEQRYEFHQEILEDFFDSFFVAGTDVYKVKSGDNLWSLCVNELEIPLWLLQKFNPTVDFTILRPGQKIVHPLVSPMGTSPDGHSQNLDFKI